MQEARQGCKFSRDNLVVSGSYRANEVRSVGALRHPIGRSGFRGLWAQIELHRPSALRVMTRVS